VTSFNALGSLSNNPFGTGARLGAKLGWGPSAHSGFAWPLLCFAASVRSAGAAAVGPFCSWAATIPGTHAFQTACASVTGLAGASGHITTRSSRRPSRASRVWAAAERGRWASTDTHDCA